MEGSAEPVSSAYLQVDDSGWIGAPGVRPLKAYGLRLPDRSRERFFNALGRRRAGAAARGRPAVCNGKAAVERLLGRFADVPTVAGFRPGRSAPRLRCPVTDQGDQLEADL